MCEDAPCCGCCGQLDARPDFHDTQNEIEDAHQMSLSEESAANWPGDGSGEDDLADYNQNEADDYREE